jgi:hypothetical protein
MFIIKLIILCVALYCVFAMYQKRSMNDRKKIPVETRLRVLKRMYEDISTVANSLGISVCLMYGTLLGCVRQNDLICYDYDLDVGVHNFEYKRLVEGMKQYYAKNAAEFDVVVHNVISKKAVIIHKKTKLNADIFRISSDDKNVWRDAPSINSTLILKECSHKIPREWMYPLQEVTFLGKQTYIPRDPAKVLSCVYGVDYEIPNHTCNTDCSECKLKVA